MQRWQIASPPQTPHSTSKLDSPSGIVNAILIPASSEKTCRAHWGWRQNLGEDADWSSSHPKTFHGLEKSSADVVLLFYRSNWSSGKYKPHDSLFRSLFSSLLTHFHCIFLSLQVTAVSCKIWTDLALVQEHLCCNKTVLIGIDSVFR